MITNENEAKITNYISCDCKCISIVQLVIQITKWNNKTCQCESKNSCTCIKNYI